jgi:predicted aminopeptidase
MYVLEAAYEESKILLNRQDIDTVIDNELEDEETIKKLQYVLAARNFAASKNMTPGDSYTKFTRVDKDVLVWVLLGSRPDSFAVHTWWYPVVGTIPYKGFFDKEDALEEAKELQELGFETQVRGSEAFSTLGWFNDPVLSTTLSHHPVRVVNTVIHEIFHQTVWVPGHVDFNESAANYIGVKGAMEFFSTPYLDGKSCSKGEFESSLEGLCQSVPVEYISRAMRVKEWELTVGASVMQLYTELSELYDSDASKEEKIEKRVEIFERIMAPLRAQNPDLKILKQINNAEIMQLKLYLTELQLFEALFEQCDGDWDTFIQKIREISEKAEGNSEVKPFDLLREMVDDSAEAK